MYHLAIKSNYTVTPEEVKPALVLIKDGMIADIVSTPPPDMTCRVIDVGNLALLPGVIDPHVHVNEPGRTEWEGFDTATRAAIAGGVTSLVDMPLNSSPVTTSVKALRQKLASASQHVHIHCGFWGGIVPGNENEIEGLAAAGVLGFKAFLTHSGIDDFPNVSETDLRKAMPVIAEYRLPLLVHCELTGNAAKPDNGDSWSYNHYLSSRPPEWEHLAVELMIKLCAEFHCRVHIVHVSSAGSAELIRKAKKKGLPLTCETAQHYLYFNAENIRDGQTQFKCAPPIRNKSNNDLLWEALKDGTIDLVATDHSPAPPGLKEMQSGDFMKAWGGISSLQFSLPSLWTAARLRGFGLNDIAKWLCENPAKLAGLENKKGRIAAGYDADLVVLDAEKDFMVTEGIIHHRHKMTPYLGDNLFGFVEQTFLVGKEVFHQGKFTRLNQGNLLIRS